MNSSHTTEEYAEHTRLLSLSRLQVVEWDEVRFDVRLMQRVPYGALAARHPAPPPRALTVDSLRLQRACRACRRRCAASTATVSCAAASPSSSRATSTRPTPAASTSRTSSPRSATASRRCVPRLPRLLRLRDPPPPLTLAPFRAQTCNFDTLYAYLSARLRLEQPTQHTFLLQLVSHLAFPCARSLWQLRLQLR